MARPPFREGRPSHYLSSRAPHRVGVARLRIQEAQPDMATVIARPDKDVAGARVTVEVEEACVHARQHSASGLHVPPRKTEGILGSVPVRTDGARSRPIRSQRATIGIPAIPAQHTALAVYARRNSDADSRTSSTNTVSGYRRHAPGFEAALSRDPFPNNSAGRHEAVGGGGDGPTVGTFWAKTLLGKFR